MLAIERRSLVTAAADERMVGVAVRAFFGLADQWRLTEGEQMSLLGDISRGTLYVWKKDPPRRLGIEQLRTLSLLLGVHALLVALFPNAPATYMATRVRRPGPFWFMGERSLVDYALEGGNIALHRLREALVAETGTEAGSDGAIDPFERAPNA